jgi:hypothetical protein
MAFVIQTEEGGANIHIRAKENIRLSAGKDVIINGQTVSSMITSRLESLQERVTWLEGLVANLTAPKPTSSSTAPSSCKEIYANGQRSSGVYAIDLEDGYGPFHVFCDMTTDGGGWTVFQRRIDGSVMFYRDWNDYRDGFGDISGEFWLGLDKIHRITQRKQMLRIDLADFNGNTRYATYSTFAVGSESSRYIMHCGKYYGNAGDSLSYHNNTQFSTKDKDNDKWSSNCAEEFKGAWWYKYCHRSNLNGRYLNGPHQSEADGVNWYSWKGHYYSLKFTEMKLRPRK